LRIEELRRCIKATEKAVDPATVAFRVQGSGLLRRLPLWLQRRIADRGARIDPYMSFVVEPYATFLPPVRADLERAVAGLSDELERSE
jgi:hypothetical protein